MPGPIIIIFAILLCIASMICISQVTIYFSEGKNPPGSLTVAGMICFSVFIACIVWYNIAYHNKTSVDKTVKTFIYNGTVYGVLDNNIYNLNVHVGSNIKEDNRIVATVKNNWSYGIYFIEESIEFRIDNTVSILKKPEFNKENFNRI